MTRNQNDDDTSWSDLNHDVLFLVMMQLGVIDFVSFSGVCKSWRSLALSNRKMFMASRPPMPMYISDDANEKECYLEDFEGRKFTTIIPHSAGRKCVGLTCGYLIFFEEETNDFWLVNPITRHRLHFPDFPYNHFSFRVNTSPYFCIGATILIFLPSISGWGFFIVEKCRDQVWFSIAGKGVWNRVCTTSYILDIYAFKGKIYTLNIDFFTREGHLYEMRFGTEPKLMLLKTKNFPKTRFYLAFVRSDENLHVLEKMVSGESYKVHELDFGEMKWVCLEETNEEYTFYRNYRNNTTVVKRESWAGTVKSRKGRFNVAYMWYFPHDRFNVNLIDG